MKRNETVDIIKGLGIFFVVLAHSGFPLSQSVYLFHMPIFFMASGYCYNLRNSQSAQALGAYAGKKLKSLYVPYALFNGIFILLYNQLIDLNIYTNHPDFAGAVEKRIWWQSVSKLSGALHFDPAATEQLCGADWFVVVLFYITLIFAGVAYLIKWVKPTILRHCLIGAFGVGCLFLGTLLQKRNFFLDDYWSVAITGMSLYILGFFLARLPSWVDTLTKKLRYILAVLGAVFFLVAIRFGNISLNKNHFTSPGFLLICSVVGWYWLKSLADILQPIKWLKSFWVLLSKSSLFILFLHFLGFKAVTAIQLAVYREEAYLLASFPVHHKEGLWWIAYTVAGVAFPVGVKLLFDWIKTKVKTKETAG